MILALIVVAVLETIGLWFVENKLVIPPERMHAAKWVYQISILTTFIAITQVPYTSAIIAHENMKVYAYVGVFEAVAKLVIVYLLSISPMDKLVFYAILVAVVQLLVAFGYRVYCVRNYEESRISATFEKSTFKEMLSFSGLGLVANVSYILSSQGLVVLINMFFQPAIVAAQAVGNQISAAMMQFVNNFKTAINPQIIKLYAAGDFAASRRLTANALKGDWYLLIWYSSIQNVGVPGKKFYCSSCGNYKTAQLCSSLAGHNNKIVSPTMNGCEWWYLD